MRKSFETFITENPNVKIEIIPNYEAGKLIMFYLKAIFINDGDNEHHCYDEIETLDSLYSRLLFLNYQGYISLHFATARRNRELFEKGV